MIQQNPTPSNLESKLTKQEDELCDKLESLVVEEQKASQRIRHLKETAKNTKDNC